jgi:hypothetical protein
MRQEAFNNLRAKEVKLEDKGKGKTKRMVSSRGS